MDVKIFGRVFDSSLVDHPNAMRALIYMRVQAQANGVVDLTLEVLPVTGRQPL